MIKILKPFLFILILFFSFNNLYAWQQIVGRPMITHFLPEDYGAASQNWYVTFDKKGRVFIGNTNGLLTYNGSSWSLLKGSNGQVVRSIGKDSNGNLYLGRNNNIGLASVDSLGFLSYKDISDLIPENAKDFKTLSDVKTFNENAYFFTSKYTFKVSSPEKLTVINAPTATMIPTATFVLDNKLHTIVRDSVYAIINDKWEYQPGYSFPNGYQNTTRTHNYDDKTVLVIENHQKLYKLVDKKLTPIDLTSNKGLDLAIRSEVSVSVKYRDWFILGTVRRGVFIFDENLELIQNISKVNGLQTDMVLGLNVDREGGLWVGTNRGVDLIDLKFPMTYWGKEDNLDNLVIDLAVHNDITYLTTSDGKVMYSENSKNADGLEKLDFKLMQRITGQAWFISELKNEFGKSFVSVGTRNGFFLDKGNHRSPLYGQGLTHVFRLYPSKKFKNRVYLSHFNGMQVYEFNRNDLVKVGDINNYNGWIYGFSEMENGDLWAVDPFRGIFKFDMCNLNPVNATTYEPKNTFYDSIGHVASTNESLVAEIDDKFLITSSKGFYYFDKKDQQFKGDDSFGELFKGRIDGKSVFINSNLKDTKNVWIVYNADSLYSYNKATKKLVYHDVLKKFKNIAINSLFDQEEKGRLWFGTGKGVYCYNYDFKINETSTFQNVFSLITTKTDTLTGGFENGNQGLTMDLSYEQGEQMVFQFSANTFVDASDQISYSYKLEGNDEEWSPWKNERKKEYTNLFEGTYTFKVRSKNNHGIEGDIVSYSFKVQPPVYRSVLAYFSYVAVFGVLIFAFVKVYTKRLKDENEKLEKVIVERTKEIRAQNEELQQQSEEILQQRDYLYTANEEISARNKDIVQLGEIGQRITKCLSIDAILNTVYDNINSMMDAVIFSIGEFNESSQKLYFSGKIKGNNSIQYGADSLEDQNSFSVYSFKNKEAVVINDVETESSKYVNEIPGHIACKSLVYLPLITKDKIMGVINVQSNNSQAYEDRHITILKSLATYVATALDNTYAYNIIKNKNENITSSLNYAQTIQQAILPIDHRLEKLFSEHFVIFRPRDIVSGDFYWLAQVENKTFISVVDCTGHGVPGAFMSMIGNSLLNQIVKEKGESSPEVILTELDKEIRIVLKQSETGNDDGMDLVLCVMEPENEKVKVTFSGAKNNLYYSKNGQDEISILKGDRKVIGGVRKSSKVFKNQEVILEKGDEVYLITDGIIDQNNEARKRLGSKRLMALFNEHLSKPMPEQKDLIEKKLDDFQNNEPQRDDITLIGLRI